jgi:hypothetical protein
MPTLNDSLAISTGSSLQLFGGDADDIAPPNDWQDPLYESINEGIIYIEVFGGDHGTDRDLHPVMALDLFKFHLKSDRSVESGLQGTELKGRAEAGEFRLRMKIDGEVYDSHPELSETQEESQSPDSSSESLTVLGLIIVLGVSAIAFFLLNKKNHWVFKPSGDSPDPSTDEDI